MRIPDFSLHNEVAVVTGARRGIGKAIALAFAEAGADVAICDAVVDDGELDRVVDEIQQLGRRSLAMQVDISRKTEVDGLAQQVAATFGTVDILFNNAAVNAKSLGQLIDLAEDEWDRIFAIDLKGYYLCAQAFSKQMMKTKKGTIISMASRFGLKPEVGAGAYSIAKAGVIMLTRVLARELGSYNIRANAIAPGMVKTEFNRHIWSRQGFLEQLEATLPLGRVAEPPDIVGAALFLASSASGYITGHTISVDGGSLA